LGQIEQSASISFLVRSILFFSLGLLFVYGAKAYIEQNKLFGRIYLRSQIMEMVNQKTMRTSYENVEKKNFRDAWTEACRALDGNTDAGEIIWTNLYELQVAVLGLIVYLFFLGQVDWFLILIVAVTAVGSFFISKHFSDQYYAFRDQGRTSYRQMELYNQQARDPSIAKDIRLFGMKSYLGDIYEAARKTYQDYAKKREKAILWADLVEVVAAILRNGAAYVYLIIKTLRQGLSASEFLLLFTAISGLSTFIVNIFAYLMWLRRNSADLSKTREFLDYPEPFLLDEGLSPVSSDGHYQIEMRDVSYQYPESEVKVLDHVNLTLHPGEKLAVVGLNGAGKTTLVKLMAGFLDPTEGAVLLNGQDVRTLNRRKYYELISAVFQQISTLSVTLAENVAQQTENQIDEERVKEALGKSGLTEKVQTLPEQEKTILGKEVYEEGIALSGGELQRLMLARALYKDGAILILDEPTAALDPIAESEMYEQYAAFSKDRSSVFISHRLASTRFCDRIVLIKDGKLIEEGTHASLMIEDGEYAKLFNVQARYYQEGVEF
jgi:ATP-binding cassette subfamily B protein